MPQRSALTRFAGVAPLRGWHISRAAAHHQRDTTRSAFSDEWEKRAVRRGVVYVNPLTYAEVATNYETIEELDASLPSEIFLRAALPFPAGFLAAKAFMTYRHRGEEKRSPLPDFYIGAHAAVDGLTLVTRDARGYRTYFPHLVLDTPSTETDALTAFTI